MDMHASRSNKRQRRDSTSLSLSHLPANVLSNCFSFLGPSGHYYFLASVSKDFKVAVDELYGDDRNTSVDSILTSVSTCVHLLKLSFDENGGFDLSKKIIEAVFENDRLDLYQGILVTLYSIRTLQDELTSVTNAIRHKSTEIMRSIIANEEMIYLLKNKEPPEGVLIRTTSEDMECIVEALSAACDPQMIQQLVGKGVVFNDISIFHSLKRKDLETFKFLLDTLDLEDEDSKEKIILQALKHEMHLSAIKYLKQTGFFDNDDILIVSIIYTIRHTTLGIDVVKAILEGRRDINDEIFKNIIALCVMHGCLDILSYIHESIKRIDIDFWIQFAEMQSLEQVVAHLRAMQ